MGRLIGGALALAILAWSTYALLFAVAISPAGSWVREPVFDADAGYCSADWLETAQIVPALAAVVAAGAALYRTARPRESAAARTVWLLAACALVLHIAWIGFQGAADCGIGGDD